MILRGRLILKGIAYHQSILYNKWRAWEKLKEMTLCHFIESSESEEIERIQERIKFLRM